MDDSDVSAHLNTVGSIPLIDARREGRLSLEMQSSRAGLTRHVEALPPAVREDVRPTREDADDWSAARTERLLRQLDARRDRLPRTARRHIDEIRACARRLYRARESLIAANLRLVVHVAKSFAGPDRPFLDLIQEGNIGLIRAAEKFDHRRGTRFSTYAHWWIKQAMQRAIAERGDLVRLPSRVGAVRKEIGEAATDLQSRLGRRPSTEEIAKSIGLSPRQVAAAEGVPRRDADFGDSSAQVGRLARIPDPRSPDPVRSLERRDLCRLVSRLLATLQPREAEVIRLRFGLRRDRVRTLEEVGEALSLSRERVRQLQASALRKLRGPAADRGLQEHAV